MTTREEAAVLSRQRCLAAGLEILTESLASPISLIRAQDVVKRTDYTAGAFYHHWPTQQAFRDDLRREVGGLWQLDERTRQLHDALGSDLERPEDAIRRTFLTEVSELAVDPGWWLEVAMLAGGDAHDIEQSRLRMSEWIKKLESLYGDLMEHFSLTFRDGFDLEWLTRSIMAIVDGYSLQLRAGLPLRTNHQTARDIEWSAPDLALAGVVTTSVRRGPDSESRRDIKSEWTALWSGPL